ncbi:hypothetical protein CEXT_789201 [Caerostris extrusa]|uniref:Uncharacterized protein n=1 Tax=Caerostris extrusa TaxID=172846 RepID=A0AAV4VAZ6_CAEEX|nr:hypothetical protein CEXT_789201 [Caerostris extrusa]
MPLGITACVAYDGDLLWRLSGYEYGTDFSQEVGLVHGLEVSHTEVFSLSFSYGLICHEFSSELEKPFLVRNARKCPEYKSCSQVSQLQTTFISTDRALSRNSSPPKKVVNINLQQAIFPQATE